MAERAWEITLSESCQIADYNGYAKGMQNSRYIGLRSQSGRLRGGNQRLLAQVQVQRKKIIKFIQGIDDSLMKQIIFYRHISCMTWNEVADIIGGGNTEMGVRKAYSRFVRDL